MLKGLAVFIDDYAGELANRQNDAQRIRQSMEWYLWHAMMSWPLSRDEQESLDAQVASYAKQIETSINQTLMAQGITPNGRAYAQLFVATYRRHRGNCFTPHTRAMKMPYELDSQMKPLAEQLRQVRSAWLDWLSEAQHEHEEGIPDSVLAAKQREYALLAYAWLFRAYAGLQSPAREPAPSGVRIVRDSGRFTDEIWVYTVGQAVRSIPNGR